MFHTYIRSFCPNSRWNLKAFGFGRWFSAQLYIQEYGNLRKRSKLAKSRFKIALHNTFIIFYPLNHVFFCCFRQQNLPHVAIARTPRWRPESKRWPNNWRFLWDSEKKDGWKPIKNGMFTTTINWYRISETIRNIHEIWRFPEIGVPLVIIHL